MSLSAPRLIHGGQALPDVPDDLATCQAALQALQAHLLTLQQRLAQADTALLSSRRRAQTARHAARHDALTGLPNRRAFDQQASLALRHHAQGGELLGVVFIDLDNFKTVNDDWGHAAGDALLRRVGETLRQTLRRDDFVCRLGGDEFVCLLPHIAHAGQARELGEKLLAAIAGPCRLGRHALQVQASAGLALYPQDGRTMPDLLHCADSALRQAKQGGRAALRVAATA